MSTPVSNLPADQGAVSPQEDDAMLNDILNDVENKIRTDAAVAQNQPPLQRQQEPQYTMNPVQIPMSASTPPKSQNGPSQRVLRPQPPPSGLAKWLNIELAKKAAILAIIAAIVFYPPVLEAVFKAVPALETYFGTYSYFVKLVPSR